MIRDNICVESSLWKIDAKCNEASPRYIALKSIASYGHLYGQMRENEIEVDRGGWMKILH